MKNITTLLVLLSLSACATARTAGDDGDDDEGDTASGSGSSGTNGAGGGGSAGNGSTSGAGNGGGVGNTGTGGGVGSTGAGGSPVLGAQYTTPPGYFDVVLDTERHRVFLSYGGDGQVVVLELANGQTTPITTGYNAEFMHFEPILDQVVISLPTAAHSAYWWDEDQEGYIGVIDAVTLAAQTPTWIALDPWQITADGSGFAYVAGGSGQWTSAIAVDLTTGWSAMSLGTVRQNTNIRIHPNLDRIYGADTGLSPSDIERWTIGAGSVEPAYDSPYHGDYPMCGDVRIHPAGSTLYTRCGHLFLASNTANSDMTWVADMGLLWDDLAFNPDGQSVYALVQDTPVLYEYDNATLAPIANHTIGLPAERILTGPGYLVLVRSILGGDPKTEVEVIPYADL
jgi:hypothetical protein